jgi:hypothetical protein
VSSRSDGAAGGRDRASALASALAALGLAASVEADGALASIALHGARASSDAPLVDAETRRAIIGAARAHGFTHVALEIADDAPLRRDQPAR